MYTPSRRPQEKKGGGGKSFRKKSVEEGKKIFNSEVGVEIGVLWS